MGEWLNPQEIDTKFMLEVVHPRRVESVDRHNAALTRRSRGRAAVYTDARPRPAVLLVLGVRPQRSSVPALPRLMRAEFLSLFLAALRDG
jgi:hypothetical protein